MSLNAPRPLWTSFFLFSFLRSACLVNGEIFFLHFCFVSSSTFKIITFQLFLRLLQLTRWIFTEDFVSLCVFFVDNALGYSGFSRYFNQRRHKLNVDNAVISSTNFENEKKNNRISSKESSFSRMMERKSKQRELWNFEQKNKRTDDRQ